MFGLNGCMLYIYQEEEWYDYHPTSKSSCNGNVFVL